MSSTAHRCLWKSFCLESAGRSSMLEKLSRTAAQPWQFAARLVAAMVGLKCIRSKRCWKGTGRCGLLGFFVASGWCSLCSWEILVISSALKIYLGSFRFKSLWRLRAATKETFGSVRFAQCSCILHTFLQFFHSLFILILDLPRLSKMLVHGTAKRIFPVECLDVSVKLFHQEFANWYGWSLKSTMVYPLICSGKVHRRAGMSIAGMVADARQIVSWELRATDFVERKFNAVNILRCSRWKKYI